MTIRAWNKLVTLKVEVKNTQRLINDCYKTSNGTLVPKTKTAHILDAIESPTYTRKTQNELLSCTKHETKSIIIARFGMLECGSNFKGTMNIVCRTCNVTDNESHRLNECPTYKTTDSPALPTSINFNDIYSSDKGMLTDILKAITKIWNTKTAHGTMKL